MPIYDYECSACGQQEEVACVTWRDKPNAIVCPNCGKDMHSIISPPQSIRPCWEPYWDPNMGDEPVLVESREHRRQLKKERNLVDQYHHRPGMPGQWV